VVAVFNMRSRYVYCHTIYRGNGEKSLDKYRTKGFGTL
jgi:hypothetical protein